MERLGEELCYKHKVGFKQEISSRPSGGWVLAVGTKAVNDVTLSTSTSDTEFRPPFFFSFHILQVFPLTFDDVGKIFLNVILASHNKNSHLQISPLANYLHLTSLCLFSHC